MHNLPELPLLPNLKGQRLNAITSGRSENFKIDPFIIRPEPGWNARTTFEGIPELAESLLANDQSDPITIRRDADSNILITDGERRWRAAIHIRTTIAKDSEHPLQEKASTFLLRCQSEPQNVKPIDRLFRQLEANSGQPFTLLEKARLYQRILTEDASLTEAELARRSQTTRQAVNQALNLVRFGAPKLLRFVEQDKISGSLANRIISEHKDDHPAQELAAAEAIETAAAAGKTHASPKHLPKPTLRFEFTPGDSAPPNQFGVWEEPPTFSLAGAPKSWKVNYFDLQLVRSDFHWHDAFTIDIHLEINGSLPSLTAYLDPEPPNEASAWYWTFLAATSRSNTKGLTPSHITQLTEAFLSTLKEKFPDQEIAPADHISTDTEEPEDDTTDDTDDEDTTGDLFTGNDDEDDTPPWIEDGTKPVFQYYQISGAPKGHPERFRLALLHPPTGIQSLHLFWGWPHGPNTTPHFQARAIGSHESFDFTLETESHEAELSATTTLLPELWQELIKALDSHGFPDTSKSLPATLIQDAVNLYLSDNEDSSAPEILEWTAPTQDLGTADPSAMERIKAAPSTNRDGSNSNSGSRGYVAPDKRLKSIEELFNKLNEQGDPNLMQSRLDTGEIILRCIHNECDIKRLKDHLLGKD